MTTVSNGVHPEETAKGITKIGVSGYKSISREQSIDIRPLTLLAGANSSGKSSIMQPLLLMKQTLEAPYDPGALLLDGPNVRFTSAEQLLSRFKDNLPPNAFTVRFKVPPNASLAIQYRQSETRGFDIGFMEVEFTPPVKLYEGMSQNELTQILGEKLTTENGVDISIIRMRCFLDFAIRRKDNTAASPFPASVLYQYGMVGANNSILVESHIASLIHVPRLRGLPSRTYPVTAVGTTFPGAFDGYTASVIAHWQVNKETEKLESLTHNLKLLGLTNSITAHSVNDTQVELKVGRRPAYSADTEDMVSIADVGFGVSQTLPVLVALLAAQPGQLVYIEQPELHLHPRAQAALASILADAAKRGVRVVAETHSALLLRGVQTLVAEGDLPLELVKLHWFTRDKEGMTTIQSADLDEAGAFGDWPEDFDDVSLQAESRYLDAAEMQLARK